MQHVYDRLGVVLVGFEKHLRGKTRFLPALPDTLFEADDAIFVIVGDEEKKRLNDTQQLMELPRMDEHHRGEALQEIGVAEMMLAPESKLIGRTVDSMEFRSRYGITVLAMRHRGAPLTRSLGIQPLDFGDTLLVSGGWTAISQVSDDRENFLVLTCRPNITRGYRRASGLQSPWVFSSSWSR
jgi:K+/H+ antiporter YhaU regulatory subunit KhtT